MTDNALLPVDTLDRSAPEAEVIPSPFSDLVAPLNRLAMTAGSEFSIDDMLRDLCSTAIDVLGVDGAGIMATHDTGLRFVHASERLVAVEQLQQDLQEGPCQDSAATQQLVIIEDIAAASTWPQFVAASELAGFGAMVAVPLLARGRSWGVLDLYRTAPGVWTDRDLQAAKLFADVAASFVAMAADRNLTKLARRDLEYRVSHDELPGLPNRTLLFDRVQHAAEATARHQSALAVLLIDVDHFKQVNDALGHSAGDVVLAEVARRVASVLRVSDTLARMCGDEFVAVCEDLGAVEEVVDHELESIVGRIQGALARPIHAGGHEVVVTVSIGAARTVTPCKPRDLIDSADQAMYRAKHEGWGFVVVKDLLSAAAVE